MASSPSSNPPVALLVEDEPLISMDAADLLEQEGYKVLERVTADAALTHLLAYDHIDLLVTDVHTPGHLDGLRLAQEVAQRWPAVVIIVVSAVAVPSQAELPPNSLFISKPLTKRTLHDALQKLA